MARRFHTHHSCLTLPGVLKICMVSAMGKDIVRFSCHHCGHCCTDVVCLPTPWDVGRIVKMTGADPYRFLEFLTLEEIDDVETSDPTWLECEDDRYIMALRRGKRGCHFLNKKTRSCTIYEARPILCRLYPFKLEETRNNEFKGFSLHADVSCPRHRDGAVSTKPLHDLYLEDDDHQDDYHELVDLFNERKYEGKEADDFIGMVMKSVRKFPARAQA